MFIINDEKHIFSNGVKSRFKFKSFYYYNSHFSELVSDAAKIMVQKLDNLLNQLSENKYLLVNKDNEDARSDKYEKIDTIMTNCLGYLGIREDREPDFKKAIAHITDAKVSFNHFKDGNCLSNGGRYFYIKLHLKSARDIMRKHLVKPT